MYTACVSLYAPLGSPWRERSDATGRRSPGAASSATRPAWRSPGPSRLRSRGAAGIQAFGCGWTDRSGAGSCLQIDSGNIHIWYRNYSTFWDTLSFGTPSKIGLGKNNFYILWNHFILWAQKFIVWWRRTCLWTLQFMDFKLYAI